MAKKVQKSVRGGLEILTLNEFYLEKGAWKAVLLGRGFARMNAGTFDFMVDA